MHERTHRESQRPYTWTMVNKTLKFLICIFGAYVCLPRGCVQWFEQTMKSHQWEFEMKRNWFFLLWFEWPTDFPIKRLFENFIRNSEVETNQAKFSAFIVWLPLDPIPALIDGYFLRHRSGFINNSCFWNRSFWSQSSLILMQFEVHRVLNFLILKKFEIDGSANVSLDLHIGIGKYNASKAICCLFDSISIESENRRNWHRHAHSLSSCLWVCVVFFHPFIHLFVSAHCEERVRGGVSESARFIVYYYACVKRKSVN